MKKALGLWVLVVGICAGALGGGEIELGFTGENEVRLDWEAIPSQRYNLYATPDLEFVPWTNLTPAGLAFSNVIGSCSAPQGGTIQYYLVAQPDLDPPTVAELVPAANAVAVATNATISIALEDATGVDTQSLVLDVAGWAGLTSASPEISWSNNTVTFTPPAALGAPGATLTNSLTIADAQGHVLSNYVWTFELAQVPEASGEFLALTAPPAIKRTASGRLRTLPNVRPKAGTPALRIQAVGSNTVVFSYEGAPPTITNGTRLVSFDAAYPFYRAVVSNAVDEGLLLITAWTEDVSLDDVLDAGSFAAADLFPADPAPGPSPLKTVGKVLHVEFGGDLSGKVLKSDGDLKLWLPECTWAFVGDVDAAADIGIFSKLKSLDAAAKGKLTVHVKPEVLFHAATSGNDQLQLMAPATKIFGGMVGIVPVWVTVTMELNALYEYDASVEGSVHAVVDMEKELEFAVQLRQKQWSHGAKNSPIVLDSEPVAWQLEGTAHAKVTIQPKVTVLVESLAGLWADFSPYAETAGQYQLNPLQYDWALYAGLSANLGIESRIWYGVWGDKPEWELYSQRWPLWASHYPNASAAPVFSGTFPHRTVPVGGSLTLSGWATGTPAPQYRWTYNGARIVGATAAEYVIPAARAGHAGTYAVQAYNSAGSVQASCTVTVTSPSQGGKPRLAWPLPSGNPYTAHCVAVLDHDDTVGRVVAYNGEVGSIDPVVDQSTTGYAKMSGVPFDLALVGGYVDHQPATLENTHLFYDNHRGFDYPAVLGTEIRAAAAGRLFAATGQTTANGGIWRNPTAAPTFNDESVYSWSKLHTFYILHGGGLSTWYLHASDLSPTVLQNIAANGYADVERGDVVGYVGAWGADGAHLHFGVRETTGTAAGGNVTAVLVDPYGNSDTDYSEILWQEQPSPPGPVPADMVFVQGGTLPDIGNGALNVDSFLIGKYEVTWGEWKAVRAEATARGYDIGGVGDGCADNHPVHVIWYHVVKWCNLRSEIEGRTPAYRVDGDVYRSGWNDDVAVNSAANGYRLPTDAQWEFAARGGTQSQGYEYSGGNDEGAVAWYWDNSGGAACNYNGNHGTWPVGGKAANELGIYDMSGNVWEWCFDWYPGYEGTYRVLRGGSWDCGAYGCRSADRYLSPTFYADNTFGFRAVVPPPGQ
jgi:murein DD-endopeptidase MepM/ murein hydrolase activator NlpD